MTWTNLTFPSESILTSTKMTQLQANFASMAAGESGAPAIDPEEAIDWDQGTFTPVVYAASGNPTMENVVGYYRRAGNVVDLIFSFSVPYGSEGSYYYYFDSDDFPVAKDDTYPVMGVGRMTDGDGWQFAGRNLFCHQYAPSGSSTIRIHIERANAQYHENLTNSHVAGATAGGDDCFFTFHLTYITDAA